MYRTAARTLAALTVTAGLLLGGAPAASAHTGGTTAYVWGDWGKGWGLHSKRTSMDRDERPCWHVHVIDYAKLNPFTRYATHVKTVVSPTRYC